MWMLVFLIYYSSLVMLPSIHLFVCTYVWKQTPHIHTGMINHYIFTTNLEGTSFFSLLHRHCHCSALACYLVKAVGFSSISVLVCELHRYLFIWKLRSYHVSQIVCLDKKIVISKWWLRSSSVHFINTNPLWIHTN